MTKDIQNVVAVFVHLSLASVLGFNVAIAASAMAGHKPQFNTHGAIAAATMLTAPAPVRTAALIDKAPR